VTGVAEKLLRARTSTVLIELTTRCNLRCVYCAVNHPDYEARDLGLDPVEIVRAVAALRPREVQISGHGESTIVAGWHELARELLALGCPLTITTNLARRLSDEEVQVLSEFDAITVSCDTADAETYALLRRGGRLERLVDNLRRLARACEEHPERRPYLAVNCVLTERSLGQIEGLVDWAADHGVACVSLTNLVVHPALASMSPGRPAGVAGARDAVERARARAHARGLDFNVMGGLREALWRA